MNERTPLSSWLGVHALKTMLAHLRRRLLGSAPVDPVDDNDGLPSDEDIEGMFDSYISNQLAALPRAYLTLVPPEVALLIREAKAFHEVMDVNGAKQEASLARQELGFDPMYHVRLRLGPHAEHYMAIPTALRCEYGDVGESRAERLKIQQHGARVIDVFGNVLMQ
jgi:hypothetical protein